MCFECGESGHAAWRCPHQSLVATETEAVDEDELDEYALYVQYDMVPAPGQRAMMTCDRVFFSPSEVFFYNIASTLVSKNPDLLSHIVPSAAFTIVGGVQKSAPWICIDDAGTFSDLGQVGVGKGASCNILPACHMVDTGRSFDCDNDKDEIVVTGTNQEYVFTRRLRADGTKARFYTRDFAHVATAAANLRIFFIREVKQMDKAEQLMHRLGHMPSKKNINLINFNIQNCLVFATDARNKDAAKGLLVAGLFGKTTKGKAISPGYVLAPRATQGLHILSIDIVFIKMVPLLLGVFTPLGLGLVHFLRDRSKY